MIKFARGSKYDFHVLLHVFNEDVKSKLCEIKHSRRYLMIYFY